jgi:hypothetical protein
VFRTPRSLVDALVWIKPADEILDKVASGQVTLDRITKSATHHEGEGDRAQPDRISASLATDSMRRTFAKCLTVGRCWTPSAAFRSRRTPARNAEDDSRIS